MSDDTFARVRVGRLGAEVSVDTNNLQSELAALPPGAEQQHVQLLNRLAWSLRNTDPAQALSVSEQALRLADRTGTDHDRAHALLARAYAHFKLSAGERAREDGEAALALFEGLDDPEGYQRVLNTLGIIYGQAGDFGMALQSFLALRSLQEQQNQTRGLADTLNNIAILHKNLSDFADAAEYQLQSLRLSEEADYAEGRLRSLLNLGRDHTAMSSPEAAIGVLEEALALASRLEHHRTTYQAHELLAHAYEASGDPVRALHHQREYHRIEKRAFNEASEQQTRRLAVQFELERARHEAEQYRLRTEITQRAREEAEAKVRERTRDLEEAQQEIVTRLAVAAEYRDDDTGEHIWRVGRNAATIARAMGWPEDEIQLVFSAARLHDIGKIGIGDAVLLKPGKLTRDEFELMRAHTIIGARILSGGRSRLLQLAEEIALAHHERWDGKGYPLGLAGEDIPASARIVAVADVLDALAHSRPYKQPWPVKDALTEIESQAGRQFDPAVVDACLRAFGPSSDLSPLDSVDARRGEPPIRLGFAHYSDHGGDDAALKIKDRFERFLDDRFAELE